MVNTPSDLKAWLNKIMSLSLDDLPASERFEIATVMAERLGLKKWPCFVMAITGTNGKGSVVAFLESLALRQGKKVGSMTSPHLIHFNERVKVNGEPVGDDEICEALAKVDSVKGNLRLGFIQYAYLACMLILQSAKLDLVLLEVGVGGLYDVTNVVDNDMTIITNIALDHCDSLGYTREAIGLQKAGLIRSSTPVIVGDPDCPESVLIEAQKKGAALYQYGKDYHTILSEHHWRFYNTEVDYDHLPKPSILCVNAATALQAFYLYEQQAKLTFNEIKEALEGIHILGRQQWYFSESVAWLFDVAHNPQAVSLLALTLQDYLQKKSRQVGSVYALFGMSADKDVQTCVRAIAPWVQQWYFCQVNRAHAVTIDEARVIFKKAAISQVCYYDSVRLAYEALKKVIHKNDIVIVFGSFSTVAEVMEVAWIPS